MANDGVIGGLIDKVFGAFDFNFKEMVVLILLLTSIHYGYQTNTSVANIENTMTLQTYENASQVLATLQKNAITEPSEILKFLSEKPAGKSNLKQGVNNDVVYDLLENDYGELARNSKIAFNY